MLTLTGKPLLYFISVFVSLGVFLFGYDQGVMSGIITGPHFNDYFDQPSRASLGTMVAILEVGALVSSLVVGRLGDHIGRKRTILYGALIFVVGGLFQTVSWTFGVLIVGRVVSGVGVGLLSTIVPVYQSEISPPHNRGKLACIEFTGNIIGYASSVWVDYACSYLEGATAWRLPLLLQCVMGLLLAGGSVAIVESPRWLLAKDRDDEGLSVLVALHGSEKGKQPLLSSDAAHDSGTPARALQEFRDIKDAIFIERAEGQKTYVAMWKRYKKRLLIAMSSQALAQLNGINVISYYAPLVFEQAGWAGRDALLMTGINSIVYMASTLPPWYLADKWGRRPILLSGALCMAVALSAISYFMYINIASTPMLVVGAVVAYNAFFGYSWGPIPWLYPPEIMPLSVRTKGASLSTATNWAFNWVVGEMTPVLQEAIGWRLYLIHAFFCVTSFVVVFFTYPETSGVNLEDMDSLFGDKTVRSSRSMRGDDAESLLPDDDTLFAAPSGMSRPSPAALARSANSPQLQASSYGTDASYAPLARD